MATPLKEFMNFLIVFSIEIDLYVNQNLLRIHRLQKLKKAENSQITFQSIVLKNRNT